MERKHYKQEINMTEALMTRINELISHYPEGKQKSALLPVLHEVQDAHDNPLGFHHQLFLGECGYRRCQPLVVQEHLGNLDLLKSHLPFCDV